MKSILVSIHCPNCLFTTDIPSDTVVIPEFEPDLKKRLKDGTFYTFTCPRCKTKIHYYHTCVYPDKKHQFVLLMKSKKERKLADHELYKGQSFVKRYISNDNEIAEKIKIFEDHYDDRAIELIKLKLLLHMKEQNRKIDEIQYYEDDKDTQTLWFKIVENNVDRMIAVTKETYRKEQEFFSRMETSKFYEINWQWALQVYKKRMEEAHQSKS